MERQTHVEQRNTHGLGRKIGLAGLLAAGGFTLAGCDVEPPAALDKVLRMGWPEGITPEAQAMGNFWVWVWVVAWIIGIVMWGIFLVAIFRWSAKRAEKNGKGEFPKQLQYNVPLELVLTGLPIVIVMALFFFTVQTQNKVTALDKDPEVTVDVTAFQWNWKFGYAELSDRFSPTNGAYDGTDAERQAQADATVNDLDANGNLPIHGRSIKDLSYLNYNQIETLGTTEEVPVLVLPSGAPVEFRLASGDVAHSFWIPEFLFKRDAYAHPETNQQQRAFQISEIEREGAFVGRCAEMCGTYHAMMNFELRVVSPEKFAEYIAFRDANPEAPNSAALEHIGEAPYAVSTHPFNSDRETADGGNFVDHNQNA
ncbi:cytochrome c oxidase subunit II [Corynebacterium renale]|uniref:cytochrome-c oxidase n=1 Tax=Corynebacterium renale TaxID=1724 RepID=A0A2A9DR44_9CORY|nr:cytochrome c oxidase subunit 2 [Corynebacterium renale]SQG65038.1 cytochrome c oxidase subunit II [Corynebacterium renale]SQI18888.1 cytochrome c oxidase subunit II [Corynebacterium renale]STC97220.1 cytochrome c oxidase subunit II [Corynebacterium renale]